MELVSNVILVDKKKGTIRVCIDYRDPNKACPNDNYPTSFIDQIVDDCIGNQNIFINGWFLRL